MLSQEKTHTTETDESEMVHAIMTWKPGVYTYDWGMATFPTAHMIIDGVRGESLDVFFRMYKPVMNKENYWTKNKHYAKSKS